MKSVLLAGPRPGDSGGAVAGAGIVELVERDIPEAGRGEVLLAVETCSLCGTDFAACRFDAAGRPNFSGPLRFPVVLGHEIAGTVRAIGEGVDRVKVGDLVAVESVLSCWSCDTCLSGLPAQCERSELLGLTRDGGLAEYVAVPALACFPLDALLSRGFSRAEAAAAGALLEPLGAVYSALFLAGRAAAPGDALVVYGLGSLGRLVGSLARLAGCCPIIGVDREPSRVEGALAHGFDDAVIADMERSDPAATAHEVGRRLLRRGADFQVDVSGSTDFVLPIAQQLLAPGGRLVILSRTRQAITADVNPWVTAAASLQGTRGRADARAFARVLALFATGRLRVRDQIARFIALAAVPRTLTDGNGALGGKIMAAVGIEPLW